MKFRTILILLMCFVWQATGIAQGQQVRKLSVSGIVRDVATGETMAGATITDSTTLGAVTNNTGFFSLKVPRGQSNLECTFLGYHTQVIPLNITGDTVLYINLKAKATDIDAVVVVGNSSGIGSQFGKVTVTMQQLKYVPLFMGEQDIFKYLQMLPGVVGGREGSSDINIRGGSGDQTLIQLDGAPIYNQNHALGFVSIFNGQALSSAELYKGGLPASIGGRLSGAVAMTTREGNRQEHKQAIGVGLLTATALLEGPISKGKGSYLISGRYFIPNLLLMAGSAIANTAMNIDYLFYDVTARLTYDLNPRNTLSLSLYNGYDAFELESILKFTYKNGKKKAAEDNGMGYNWMTSTGTLKLNSLLGRGLCLNTSVYYSGMNSSVISYYNNYSRKFFQENELRSTIHEMGLSSILEQRIGRHTLNYGIQASYQHVLPKEDIVRFPKMDPTVQSYGTFDLSTIALFVDDNVTLGKWDLYFGLRAPVYSNKATTVYNLEPRIGASVAINAKHSLYASLDRNTQPNFTLNRQFGGQPIDFWMPIQDDRLQASNQVAIGWKYKPIPSLFFSIEAYYKQLKNVYYVFNEDELLTGVGGYNVGDGYSFGGEFVAQYTGRTTLVTLSYTQSESKRVLNGVRHLFQYDVPYNLNVFVKQQTFKRGDRIHHVSANLIFKAGLPYVLSNEVFPMQPFDNYPPSVDHPVDGQPIFSNPMYPNRRLPNYFRIDLNYSMEKKLKRGSRVWQFSILNVTNHFNPQYVYPSDNGFLGVTLMPIMPSFSYKRIF